MLTKEQKHEYQRQYYQKNKLKLDEERKTYTKKWRDAHRDELNEQQMKNYYASEERRQKHRECSRQYYLKNKKRLDDYQRIRNGSVTREYQRYLRQQMILEKIKADKERMELISPLPTTCEIDLYDIY